jgi:hypothetical protein
MTAPVLSTNWSNASTKKRATYLSGGYKEARLRGIFLGPFFESLGWNVNNNAKH